MRSTFLSMTSNLATACLAPKSRPPSTEPRHPCVALLGVLLQLDVA